MSLSRALLIRLSVLLVFLFGASSTSLAWSPSGRARVVDEAGDQAIVRAIPDGIGGFFMQFTDYSPPSGLQKVRLLRVDGNGLPSTGWPVQGVLLGLQDQENSGDLVPDGEGGVFVTWTDVSAVSPDQLRMLIGRIDQSGSPHAGWPPGGRVLATHGVQGSIERMLPTPEGGCLLLWRYHIPVGSEFQHGLFLSEVDAVGAPVPTWPDTGVRIVASDYVRGRPALLRGSDGAIWAAWCDAKNDPSHQAFVPFSSRILPNGLLVPGWPDSSLRSTPLTSTNLTLEADASAGSFLLASGEFFRHADSTGIQVPGWGHGNAYSAFDAPPLFMAADAAGGLYGISGGFQLVTSLPHPRGRLTVTLRHFGPNGLPSPSWPDTFRVLDVGPLDDTHTGPTALVADGSGGAFAFWNHVPAFSAPSQLYAIRYDYSGAVAPGWRAGGALVDSSGTSLADGAGFSDGQGGACLVAALFLAAGPTRSGFDYDIIADRVVPNGPVPALAALVSASASDGVAQLEWWTSLSASESFAVERRDASSDWQRIALVAPDGVGRLRYEDASVRAGDRFGYRIVALTTAKAFGEVWLDVPRAVLFALGRLRAEDAGRTLRASYTLDAASEPRLLVFDVAGRLRYSVSLGVQPVGNHEVRLALPAMGSGLYFGRLQSGTHTREAKLIIAR